MRFYTNQHKFYCGIDLHAKTMYLCILNQEGKIVLHRDIKTSPDTFLKTIAPYREDIVVAERFADLSIQKSIELDVSLIDHYDTLLNRLEHELSLIAKGHDADSYFRLRSIPGIGRILGLVILYEIHDINRFTRVQDFVSYCRLVKSAKESGGKKLGTSGKKIGNAHLKWAFSEAAVLFLRKNPEALKYRNKLARTVYYILKRKEVFQPEVFFAK
jgi:transposase